MGIALTTPLSVYSWKVMRSIDSKTELDFVRCQATKMKTMTSTPDQKPDFLFANCEQCQGIVRIPITVRPESSVSCPHCNQQFKLANVLAQQVPEVQLIDGLPESLTSAASVEEPEFNKGTEKQDGKFIVPPQLAAGIRKRRRRRRSSSEKSSSSRAQASTPPSGTSSNHTDRPLSEAEESKIARREEHARQKRDKLEQQRKAAAKRQAAAEQGHDPNQRRESSGSRESSSSRQSSKRSPVVEALKIAVGGMVAIPIAYLLLMWVFSRDPLSLKDSIGAVAPSLLPPAFKFEDESDETPKASDNKGVDVFDSLPVPETDPDDIDSQLIDLG